MKKKAGLAVWCMLYSAVNGVDEDDLPSSLDEDEFRDFLESSEYLDCIGVSEEECEAFTDHAEELVEADEYPDEFSFYDEYAEECLQNPAIYAEVKDIIAGLYSEFPGREDTLEELFASVPDLD